MISKSHMKTLSKARPADVWCLDSLGEHLIRFDRLSLCSQINAIPIEDVVAMLTEIQLEIDELDTPNNSDAYMTCSEIIQQKINALRGN